MSRLSATVTPEIQYFWGSTKLDLADRLEEVRKKLVDAHGITQGLFATNLLHTSNQTIDKTVNGDTFLNAKYEAILFLRLGVSPNWFWLGEGPMFTPTENRPGEKERLEQLKIELDKLTEEELKEFGLWLLLRDRD